MVGIRLMTDQLVKCKGNRKNIPIADMSQPLPLGQNTHGRAPALHSVGMESYTLLESE